MADPSAGAVAVCGATGRQGGAVVRHLLAGGWQVRALTRSPEGPRARALAEAGAEVVAADMDDAESLRRAFEGAEGVYSVQNPYTSGFEQEIVQGKNVASTALAVGVRHLVYASAGVGRRTGVGSWDTKVAVEEHIGEVGIPATILRPMAFMELMTDKAFYPAASTWHVMPKLMGPERPVTWLALDDLGRIAAQVFEHADRYVGRTLPLMADVRSNAECRQIWRDVRGRPPRRFPLPVRLFERVAGTDLTTMWRWLRTGDYPLDAGPTRELLPDALDVREWLRRTTDEGRKNGGDTG